MTVVLPLTSEEINEGRDALGQICLRTSGPTWYGFVCRALAELEAYTKTAKEAGDALALARDEILRLQALLHRWIEVAGEGLHGETGCRLDHHGYCQAHFMEEDCLVPATITAISIQDTK